MEIRNVNVNIQPSRRISPKRGKLLGAIARSEPNPEPATAKPSVPPAKAINMLSVSSWRMRRTREAPIATRTAISRPRELPRARNKLATLAHAISSTKPIAPSRTSRNGRIPAPIMAWYGLKLMTSCCPTTLGYLTRKSRVTMSICDWSCSRVTPGFSRAITLMFSPLPAVLATSASGTQTSARTPGCR